MKRFQALRMGGRGLTRSLPVQMKQTAPESSMPSRRRPGRWWGGLITLAIGLSCQATIHTADGPDRNTDPAPRTNVLLLMIDDLRNTLGNADPVVRTPNLDRLAASGRLFSRHYVQVPTCGASRCSLLRGRHPELPAHLHNNAIAVTHADWADVSLPAWFRRHGYRTLALGKVTHYPGGRTGRLWTDGPEELPGAWDRSWIPETPWGPAQHLMHGYANGRPRNPGISPPWEAFDGPDEAYPDAWVAAEAIRTLRELAGTSPTRNEAPWFFAVGFFKPHLPFAAPKRWFDLYNPESFSDPSGSRRPDGVSGWHGSGEFRGNYGHDGRDPDTDPTYARLLRQAYAASTSYMDAQVGRVLDELQALKLAARTVVVLWSDHGFLLGEHAIWGKHCLYEEALRAPLIIRTPGMVRPGEVTAAIVESVDVFPTLTALAGLPTPANLHGRGLLQALADPDTPSIKPAHGFFTRNQRTIRTDRWRLVAHNDDHGGLRGVELFDYDTDPDESRNLASKQPAVVQELLTRLDAVPSPARSGQ